MQPREKILAGGLAAVVVFPSTLDVVQRSAPKRRSVAAQAVLTRTDQQFELTRQVRWLGWMAESLPPDPHTRA